MRNLIAGIFAGIGGAIVVRYDHIWGGVLVLLSVGWIIFGLVKDNPK